jgi:hypothetical protein
VTMGQLIAVCGLSINFLQLTCVALRVKLGMDPPKKFLPGSIFSFACFAVIYLCEFSPS